MYTPRHHAQHALPELQRLMQTHAFATLVTQGPDGPVADHLPLHLDASAGEFGTLRGHVARANPVWRGFDGASPCLAVFLGPNAYITPNWYPSKAEDGRAVPTWDYLAVHARGAARVVDDPAQVLALLTALTDTHEGRQQAEPWRVSDAPPEYIAQMMRAIVAFEMPIDSLQARWKHSQSERAGDRAGTEAGLRARGHADDLMLAAQMRAAEPDLSR